MINVNKLKDGYKAFRSDWGYSENVYITLEPNQFDISFNKTKINLK